MSGWDYLAEQHGLAAIFNDAMTSMSELAIDPVVAAYDFAPFHTIVDAEAVTILSNVRKAATPGTTLLLVELVIPDHNREFPGKWVDMEMLVQAGARERTATEYRKLLEQAGFEMTRVVPTAAPFSLVEGKAV